jgi:hypothetical protein
VEEEKELSLAAHQFCLQNSISFAACERIRVFHQQKCFPRDEITSNRLEGSEQSKDSDSDNESDRDSDRGIETGEPSPSLPLLSHTGIDYSQRVGPVLPVTHQQVTRHLQAFLGETSAEAIQRFCGMMKLLPDQCQQVREAYLTLLKGEKERLRGGEEDGASATDPSAAGDGALSPSSSSSPLASASIDNPPSSQDQPTLLTRLEEFVRGHWKYLLLAVVLGQVILDNPIQW